MMQYIFDSYFQYGPRFDLYKFTEAQIKAEPMLFSADMKFASYYGGPITRAFLEALPPDVRTYPMIVDSRVHMLMPGWYPCIPGWHHDDVPRGTDGQPNYNSPEYLAKHAFAIFGDASVTSLASGRVVLPEPPKGSVTYGLWHPLVEAHVKAGSLTEVPTPVNQMIHFDWQTFHKGNPATKAGWRFFIRASWNTKRKPLNEIRTQVQVYMNAENEGW